MRPLGVPSGSRPTRLWRPEHAHGRFPPLSGGRRRDSWRPSAWFGSSCQPAVPTSKHAALCVDSAPAVRRWAGIGAKNLSRLGLSPCDDGTGEVEHGEVVPGQFFPADQDTTEAAKPGMRDPNHPAPSLLADLAPFWAASQPRRRRCRVETDSKPSAFTILRRLRRNAGPTKTETIEGVLELTAVNSAPTSRLGRKSTAVDRQCVATRKIAGCLMVLVSVGHTRTHATIRTASPAPPGREKAPGRYADAIGRTRLGQVFSEIVRARGRAL